MICQILIKKIFARKERGTTTAQIAYNNIEIVKIMIGAAPSGTGKEIDFLHSLIYATPP